MLSKLALAAVVVVAVAHDIKTQINAQKAAQIYLKAHEAHKEMEAISEHQIKYLMHILEEHDIELSEFNLLALNFNSH